MAKEVLVVSEAPIATVQLVEQMLAHLSATTGLGVRSRLVGEVQTEDLSRGTYPLLVRTSNIGAERFARDLRRSGVSYGYYLDDNFWLLDPSTPIGAHYADRAHRKRLDTIVRGASSVITSTPLLRDFVRPMNRRVTHLESFFDFTLVPTLPRPHRARRAVRVGFAASLSRGPDLGRVLADVLEALEAHPDLEFEIIGLGRGDVPRHPRIRRFAYRDSYPDYVAFLLSRGWDFGLAPLDSAPSNLYKTDNKFREYAAHGIPGIYQDAAPYRSVRDRETGLLAGSTRSWREAIETYLAEPDLRTQIRSAARADAEERVGITTVAPAWAAFFDGVPGITLSAQRLDQLHGRIAARQTVVRRALHRVHLLWTYGVEQWRRDGFGPTFLRTIKFLGKRLFGR